jgi:hypothetical protein
MSQNVNLYKNFYYSPLAVLNRPPLTEESPPLAVLPRPPLTEEKTPLAVMRSPPLTTAKSPLIVFVSPTTRPPTREKLYSFDQAAQSFPIPESETILQKDAAARRADSSGTDFAWDRASAAGYSECSCSGIR